MIRDRLAIAQCTESIHGRYPWTGMDMYCTEGDGYNIWGKGLHGENVFAGGDVYNLWWFYTN